MKMELEDLSQFEHPVLIGSITKDVTNIQDGKKIKTLDTWKDTLNNAGINFMVTKSCSPIEIFVDSKDSIRAEECLLLLPNFN